jgi:hypothetical protein
MLTPIRSGLYCGMADKPAPEDDHYADEELIGDAIRRFAR